MMKRIAIQGFEGCFHQEAARQFFGEEVQIIPCATFKELIQIAQDKYISDGGMMAIENSIAGTILPNYHLLQKSNLEISGEVYLQIDQNLLVNRGVQLEDIREVHSHPMALLQCSDFLEKYNWKLIETEDTALSAKWIHTHNSKHIAGVAGKLAAQLFHLDVLVPNIHTQKNNFTRFWALEIPSEKKHIPNANKASLLFETDHSKGSLARVLTQIAACDINLSKLQSMPIPASDWKYSFHADCEFTHREQLEEVLEKIESITAHVKVYGIYKNGKI